MVKQYSVPKKVKQVRSYLGLASFYRRLIPNFAEIARPLTRLLKKDVPFTWDKAQQTAFDTLKEILCSDTVLAYPDFSAQFLLTTDASRTALGAILSQVQGGVERPLAYASRQVNSAERNYSASELELLAVTWVARYFRFYLYGSRFLHRTDHSALTYLRSFADNSRLMRWSLKLAELDFEIQHRPGKSLPHVDALSRNIQAVTTPPDISKEIVLQKQQNDEFCKSIKPTNVKGRGEFFLDEANTIYQRRKSGEPKLVVPKDLVNEVIALNHNPIYASHPGQKRT
jgi:hypothetical protein